MWVVGRALEVNPTPNHLNLTSQHMYHPLLATLDNDEKTRLVPIYLSSFFFFTLGRFRLK